MFVKVERNEANLSNNSLLKYGILGTLLTALCCFTPVLVVLSGAVGLSAFTGYIDVVLLPVLAIFIIITFYELWKRRTK